MAFSLNDLNYEKDSKERMPWEHYMEEYKNADPAEIAQRLEIPYDEEKKVFTLTMLGTEYQITYPDFQVSHTPDDKGFYPSGISDLCENSHNTFSSSRYDIYRYRGI